MKTKWTKEQNDVIQFRNCNILVSAAAGSGKTAVLVERIISMLMDMEHPVDIDRMLIVTFTNAAAGEMKERIRLAIDQKLEEDLETDMEEHLQRQIALLGNAQISTIHSFCQFVIRNYFHVIDLDPVFRIMDEGESKLLISDVLQRILEKAYQEADPEFLLMTESIATGKDDHGLEDMVLGLYHFSQSFADPVEWLQERKKDYGITDRKQFLELPWLSLLVKQCQEQLSDIQNEIERALLLTRASDGPYMYETMLLQDEQMLKTLLEAKDYTSLEKAFASRADQAVLSRKKDDAVDAEKREKVKDIRSSYKKALKKLDEEYFYASPEEIMGQMNRQSMVVGQLIDLTIHFLEEFEKEKRKKNLCDFNDLEHLALRILDNDQVADDLADRFEQIMIDEYQDSNMVQEILLRRVSREKRGIFNMFMVGDVKQSIYRFRLARPELFMDKYDTYSTEGGNDRRIDLHKNFRSRAQVLDSVNDLFEKLMLKNLGGVEYDEAARLNTGAVFEDNAQEVSYVSEIQILDIPEDVKDDTEESVRELEARMIGQRIQKLLKEQLVWDKEKKEYRYAQYKDIVILLRTMSGWSEAFVKILQNMGIPAFAGSRSGYFSAPEVQIMLAFLRLIDNPRQDIPLTAVLYSPIGKMNGEKLARIKCLDKNKPFYQVCMETEELTSFFQMLDEFRVMASYMPVHELIRLIMDTTGYYLYEASLPGGEQRAANLDMLVEKASAYEKGSFHGLYNFVRYMESLEKYEIDFGEADTLTGETNMVQIMSIHKSKGLEFPIVFASGMGKTMNQMDSRSKLVMHADYGIGLEETDPVLRVKRVSLIRNVLKKQIKNETLGEELRVLYVALTRAKEKLILTGTLKKAEETLEKYMEKGTVKEMSYSDRSGATTYFDWILPISLQMKQPSSINIEVKNIQELVTEEKEKQREGYRRKEFWESLSPESVFDLNGKEQLRLKLEFQYPFGVSFGVPSKVSVSELKAMSYLEAEEESHALYQSTEVIPVVPEFLKSEHPITGAGKGTIYHKLMECIDFSGSVNEEIAHLVESGVFTEEESSVIDKEKITKFCTCTLGRRMADAQIRGELFREQQFVLEETAGELCEQWGQQEKVLVQGIIDAYFLEKNEIILVDYKTDRVNFEDASSLYDKYKVQLECYKKALERLTGRKVKETYIYSFYLDQILSGAESHDR